MLSRDNRQKEFKAKIGEARDFAAQGKSYTEIHEITGLATATIRKHLGPSQFVKTGGKRREKHINKPTLLPETSPVQVLDGFFGGFEKLIEEVKMLRKQNEELSKLANKWAARVVEIQELLAKKQ